MTTFTPCHLHLLIVYSLLQGLQRHAWTPALSEHLPILQCHNAFITQIETKGGNREGRDSPRYLLPSPNKSAKLKQNRKTKKQKR